MVTILAMRIRRAGEHYAANACLGFEMSRERKQRNMSEARCRARLINSRM